MIKYIIIFIIIVGGICYGLFCLAKHDCEVVDSANKKLQFVKSQLDNRQYELYKITEKIKTIKDASGSFFIIFGSYKMHEEEYEYIKFRYMNEGILYFCELPTEIVRIKIIPENEKPYVSFSILIGSGRNIIDHIAYISNEKVKYDGIPYVDYFKNSLNDPIGSCIMTLNYVIIGISEKEYEKSLSWKNK